MFGALLWIIAASYVLYRLSLSVRSVRARRAGDHDRAGRLSQNGVLLTLWSGVLVTLVGVAAIAMFAR